MTDFSKILDNFEININKRNNAVCVCVVRGGVARAAELAAAAATATAAAAAAAAAAAGPRHPTVVAPPGHDGS